MSCKMMGLVGLAGRLLPQTSSTKFEGVLINVAFDLMVLASLIEMVVPSTPIRVFSGSCHIRSPVS